MSLTRMGTEFLANTTTDAAESVRDVIALSDGRFVVTYTNWNFTGSKAFARVFNSDGTESVPEFIAYQAPQFSFLELKGTALPNGEFILVWNEMSGSADTSISTLRAQVYGSDGTATGSPITVSDGEQTLRDSIGITSTDTGGFAVSWRAIPDRDKSGNNLDNAETMLRVFDASGNAVTDEIDLSAGFDKQNHNTSATTLANGNIVVTWFNDDDPDGETPFPFLARIYTATGTAIGGAIEIGPHIGPSSSVVTANPENVAALTGGGFVATWHGSTEDDLSSGGILARLFNTDGTPRTDTFLVNQTTFDLQTLPSVTATPDGGFAIAFTDYSDVSQGDPNVIRLRTFDANGQATSEETLAHTVTNSGILPYVDVVGSTSLAVAWFGAGAELGDNFQGGSAVQLFSLGGTSATNGADELTGTTGDDTLAGLGGNDRINGLAGNDVLVGAAGNDILDGGSGTDTASYEDATGAVQVYLSAGLSRGADGYDRLTEIENLTGSSFADRLVGDSGANVLRGGAGDDILKGKGGTDNFFGGGGADRIIAGDGTDTINGDSGDDELYGLGGGDVLSGGTGDDFLYGGRDNDTLNGEDGADRLRGNRGDDTLNGGEGADDLRGGGGNDALDGGVRDDFLSGESGNDTLHGSFGNDSLNGGAGADEFVFETGGGYDRIKDFENGVDRINLSNFAFSDFATDVTALASDTAFGLRLDFGSGHVLLIETMSLAEFDASDVILS